MQPPAPTKEQMKEGLKRLEKASSLIASEKAWCASHYALDAKGAPVHPRSKDAKSFCSYGALIAVDLLREGKDDDTLWLTTYSWLVKALKEIVPDDNEPSLQVYNDKHSHAEIVALFAKAKEIAKKEIKSA